MVLYFTGTGNSRYLARRIAEGLEMPLYDLNACIKAAFVERSGTMKAPVGLSSDRTVLRQQDGGASPRQVPICWADGHLNNTK